MNPVKRYLAEIGRRGGESRASNLTPAERSAAASLAASAPRKPDAPRCPCGAMTLKRALARRHKC